MAGFLFSPRQNGEELRAERPTDAANEGAHARQGRGTDLSRARRQEHVVASLADFELVEGGACSGDLGEARDTLARRWKDVSECVQVFRVSVALSASCDHLRRAEMVDNALPSVGTLDQRAMGI